MANSTLEETSPSLPPESRGRQISRGVIIGIIVFILVAGLGALGGYQVGVSNRVTEATLQIAIEAINQFEQARVEFEAGECEVALQRIEYVIQKSPDYPGATELLSNILICMQSTATPTIAPTATLTPTPDLRGVEELFQQALSLRDNLNWDVLLETLDSLRQQQPDYRAVEVDGLYFIAYRSRGIYRIQNEGNLEGGIFDLNRAERFGPLDVEAQNYRQWAEWYLTGSSFWALKWDEVITYMGYVASGAPNLRDSSGFTASARLATAQVEYSFALVLEAKSLLDDREWCGASERYNLAAQYAPLDPTAQPYADEAAVQCQQEQEEDND